MTVLLSLYANESEGCVFSLMSRRWDSHDRSPEYVGPTLESRNVMRSQWGGVNGRTCVIQASTNLTDWQNTRTNFGAGAPI